MPKYRYSTDLGKESKERSGEEVEKRRARLESAITLLKSWRSSEATTSVDFDHLERPHSILTHVPFSDDIMEKKRTNYESVLWSI